LILHHHVVVPLQGGDPQPKDNQILGSYDPKVHCDTEVGSRQADMEHSHHNRVHLAHDLHLQSTEKVLGYHMLEAEELGCYFRVLKVDGPKVECDEDPEQNY
jgi:DNA repair exonuclease SbcCD nuclease subunit